MQRLRGRARDGGGGVDSASELRWYRGAGEVEVARERLSICLPLATAELGEPAPRYPSATQIEIHF